MNRLRKLTNSVKKKFLRRNKKKKDTQPNWEKIYDKPRQFYTWTLLEIFVIVLIFEVYFLYGKSLSNLIPISNTTASDFFSVISQILGTVVGFIVAVLIFMMQFLDQVKGRVYSEYRQKVYDLNAYLQANPPEANTQSYEQLIQISYFVLSRLNLSELPISTEGFNKISRPLLVGHKKLQRKVKRELLTPEEFLSFQYTSFILPIIVDIEDGLYKLRVIYTGYKLFVYESKVVIKLLIVLLFSLISFVVFRGNISFQPDSIFSIVFSFLFLTILILFEFYSLVKYMLKNFLESWRWA